MSKRTLKWIAVERENGNWDVVYEGNFCNVATIPAQASRRPCDRRQPTEARKRRAQNHALLIAAAPELLAALELMLSSPTYGDVPSDEAVEAARAAIAKAKGKADA